MYGKLLLKNLFSLPLDIFYKNMYNYQAIKIIALVEVALFPQK